MFAIPSPRTDGACRSIIVYETPIKDERRDTVAKAIRENGAKTDINALYEGIIGCTAAATENVRKNDPPVRDIACDAGCAYCRRAGERIFEEAASRLPPRSRQTENATNDAHNVA